MYNHLNNILESILLTKLNKIPTWDISCLKGLLNEEKATCDVMEVGKREQILEPEKGFILVLNGGNVKIRPTCSKQFEINFYLITYNDCNIVIKDQIFENTETKLEDDFRTTIPLYKEVKINNTIEELNLKRLHLETMKTRNRILTNKKITTNHLIAIYAYLIIVTGIILLLLYLTSKMF